MAWIKCHGMAPCNNVIIFHCVLGFRLWRNRKCWEQPEHWSLVQTATSLQLFLAPCVIPKKWYPIEPIFVDVTNTINYFLFSFVFWFAVWVLYKQCFVNFDEWKYFLNKNLFWSGGTVINSIVLSVEPNQKSTAEKIPCTRYSQLTIPRDQI